MTAASGEKVLVWQSTIGGRCITATGRRFDAGESGNRGSCGWCSSNGMGSRSGGRVVRGIGAAPLR
jgi:hypothetical protein